MEANSRPLWPVCDRATDAEPMLNARWNFNARHSRASGNPAAWTPACASVT